MVLGFLAVTFVTGCLSKTRASTAAVQDAGAAAALTGSTCSGTTRPVITGYDSSNLSLAFCDSFNDSTLNSKNWVTNFGWGNITKPTGNEDHEVSFDLDAYFDPSLVSLGNGMLTLNAVNKPNPASTHGAPWTSSAISGHFQFEYGYIEASIRAPDTGGFWPAFWISFPFNWPPEIDVMELRTNMAGHGVYDYQLNVNYIYGPAWNNKSSNYLLLSRAQLQQAGLCDPSEASCGKKFSQFQTYAVGWQPGSLDYYINGVKIFHADIQDEPRNHLGALIINLSVGGWANRPDSNTDWSKAHMDVDWVRIWSFPSSPTVLQFAADAPTPAAPTLTSPTNPVAPAQTTPPAAAAPAQTTCPAGNDGSGAQWCDCSQTTSCFAWCLSPTTSAWGYETAADGTGHSCHAKP